MHSTAFSLFQHAQKGWTLALSQPGWQPILDAVQERRDPKGRSLPGLFRDTNHPLPLSRIERKPALGVQWSGEIRKTNIDLVLVNRSMISNLWWLPSARGSLPKKGKANNNFGCISDKNSQAPPEWQVLGCNWRRRERHGYGKMWSLRKETEMELWSDGGH